MLPRVLAVGDDGLHLDRGVDASLDVHFDGWRGWSTSLEERAGAVTVAWPRRLKDKLNGRSRVRVTLGETTLFEDEVVFGSGEGRVAIVDREGNPVIIDKWGLAQRPFETRRETGGVEAMTSMAERVLGVMRERCGIEGWISFGTLLGAARSGQVIGHDSDIDLCYLSERETPAEMAVELWDVARALVDEGITVKHKTASFITVVYKAPDGGEDGIDIYTCFYVGDLLHETATVRERVPREAVVPLRTLEFEGRQMPAPADPDRLLSVSYGPGWRVPDPSFQHQPGKEITGRFDAWFGSVMTQWRDWIQDNGAVARRAPGPSPFARWVGAQLEDVDRVYDIGSGGAQDLPHYVAQGCKVFGYDFAHPGRWALGGSGPDLPAEAARRPLNLLDERDVLVVGAAIVRQGGRKVVTARRLLEAVPPHARDRFWTLASMALARGGHAYVEGVSRSPRECRRWQERTGSPRVWPIDPADMLAPIAAAGGRVVHREGLAAASRASRTGGPAQWRLVVEWPPHQRKGSTP